MPCPTASLEPTSLASHGPVHPLPSRWNPGHLYLSLGQRALQAGQLSLTEVAPGERPGRRYSSPKVDLGESLHLTEPYFSQLYKEDNHLCPPGPPGFLRRENVIMLLDGLGRLSREVMDLVHVSQAQAADPGPHDIHPPTPRGNDTRMKPSDTCGETCEKWGIVGPLWTGPTPHPLFSLTGSWVSTPGVHGSLCLSSGSGLRV